MGKGRSKLPSEARERLEMTRRTRIAIIGAGITGMQLAARLSMRADVKVFEKSRGIGGRMSTRRADAFQFDHGAQYFTAHGQAFQDMLEPHILRGTVARWTPRLTALGADAQPMTWTAPRYVAVPGMNALCKVMAEELEVARQTHIAAITKAPDDAWQLSSETGEDCGTFDWVLSTAPAEQAAKLMPASFSQSEALSKALMLGCYSLMLGGVDVSALTWDAAIVEGSALAWIAVNHSKPGRSSASSLMCQSSNVWAEQHLEDETDTVQAALMGAANTATGLNVEDAQYISLHKWRFAKVDTPAAQPYLIDLEQRLGAAGDWCGAGRVEAGFDSGDALASAVLDQL